MAALPYREAWARRGAGRRRTVHRQPWRARGGSASGPADPAWRTVRRAPHTRAWTHLGPEGRSVLPASARGREGSARTPMESASLYLSLHSGVYVRRFSFLRAQPDTTQVFAQAMAACPPSTQLEMLRASWSQIMMMRNKILFGRGTFQASCVPHSLSSHTFLLRAPDGSRGSPTNLTSTGR